MDCTLRDHATIGGNTRRKLQCDIQRLLERPQIAVVDTDEARSQFQGALKLGRIMRLDEHVHAMLVRGGLQLNGKPVRHRRHDDQDCIGTPRPRLEDLIRIDDEALSHGGKRAGGPRCDEMVGRPLEGWCVGQYREAGSATTLVGFGERVRLKIVPDDAP